MSNNALNFVALICVCVVNPLFLQRYSVDFTSRPDEANIPLSTMEPELPIDTVSQNGQSNTPTLYINYNVTHIYHINKKKKRKALQIQTDSAILLLQKYFNSLSMYSFQDCKPLKVQKLLQKRSKNQRQNRKCRRSRKVWCANSLPISSRSVNLNKRKYSL